MEPPIFAFNFSSNMSKSGWSWHKLWNFLTIFSLIKIFSDYLDSWKTNLWNSLILDMIWSLIHHVEQQPPISLPRKFVHSPVMKSFFLEKGLLHFRGALCPCSTENSCGVTCFLNVCNWLDYQLINNILDLTKMRTVWRNRSVGEPLYKN